MPGALVDMPSTKQTNVTIKRAPRARAIDSVTIESPLVHGPLGHQEARKPARPARRKT